MMKMFKNLAAVISVAILVTGCASVQKDDWKSCAMAGAAMGGAAGGFGDDHDRSDLIVSAIGGAIVGGTVCALMAEDEVEVVAPEPVDGDADGDGVADSIDQCPTTPAGASVDANGCALDSDNDGVADYKDQCPESAPGAVVNELGCAKPLVLEGVNFHFDSAELTEEAKAILKPIATAHHTYHGDVNLLITGHTDFRGTVPYNQDLSERRAASVRAFLVSHGCDASKLFIEGYGETKPIADNNTKEGRAKNRRVELSEKK